jgi:predicted transcriptional regulator
MTTDEFKDKIEDFLVRHGMNATAFGKESCRDSAFVFRIRKGRSPSLKKANDILKWMREYEEKACKAAA